MPVCRIYVLILPMGKKYIVLTFPGLWNNYIFIYTVYNMYLLNKRIEFPGRVASSLDFDLSWFFAYNIGRYLHKEHCNLQNFIQQPSFEMIFSGLFLLIFLTRTFT